MKKVLSILSLALVVLTFVSCSKNSPEGVIQQYVADIQAGQYEDAIDLFYFKKSLTDSQKQQYATMLRDKLGKELDKKGGISGVEITNVEMAEDGESANVSYTIKYGDGSAKASTDKVVKVDGDWKLETNK
ncbi:MAG: DUF4878 domain-containing protein [Prevotellaceae bacterium]|nr:DUF4878 domain-containing protein [Prevotellaceae bacterium]